MHLLFVCFQSLVPIILLSAADEGSANKESRGDAAKYLTDCTLILTGADSDESIAKILR